jgi:MoaA/NifB/PqqE/SkfB family radical SAM enzyme
MKKATGRFLADVLAAIGALHNKARGWAMREPVAGQLADVARRRATGQPARAPLRVTLEVTGECNSRCTHCAIWQTKRAPDDDAVAEFSPEELATVVERLIALGVGAIDLTGGEPFLRHNTGALMARILAALGFVCVTTSGLLPGRTLAAVEQALAGAPPDALLVVSVSLDGLEETHDRVRGIPGGFAKAAGLLRRLQAIHARDPRLHPQVSVTLDERNAHEAPALLAALLAQRLIAAPDAFSFRATDGGAYYGTARPARPREALAQAIEAFCASSDFGASNAFYQGIAPWLRGASSPVMGARCHAGFTSCWIDSRGAVSACIQMTDIVWGNLRDTGLDLAPIWHGAAAAAVRARIAAGGCPDCWTDCQAEENLMFARLAHA